MKARIRADAFISAINDMRTNFLVYTCACSSYHTYGAIFSGENDGSSIVQFPKKCSDQAPSESPHFDSTKPSDNERVVFMSARQFGSAGLAQDSYKSGLEEYEHRRARSQPTAIRSTAVGLIASLIYVAFNLLSKDWPGST